MHKTTRYFKNCLGVFQGGGCKALAFVGAYKEALNRGVFFSEVAGTSAGSIISALIAAGATPDYLEQAIMETDFSSFSKDPIPNTTPNNHNWSKFFLSISPAKKHRLIAQFMTHFGIYSSGEIEKWIEGHLRTLLGFKSNRVVKFEDLYLPLHVVAAQLGKDEPTIWSTSATPEFSVARAVRCSCTIPVYFQPVENKYVDGGIVSNLPSFALNGGHSRNFEKILCFTFAPTNSSSNCESEPQTEDSLISVEDYAKQLISTIIDGAVSIQGELQPNLHNIEIGNLTLGTLDFSKVNKQTIQEMFNAGEVAAKTFFNEETINLKSNFADRLVLKSEPETLNHIVREEGNENDEIYISLKSNRYVYNLYPSLLNWSMGGAKIFFLTIPPSSSEDAKKLLHEKFRRLILEVLGSNLIETSYLPFEGVIFKRMGNLENAIILNDNRAEEFATSFAVKYDKTYDAAAINSMFAELSRIISSANTGDHGTLITPSIKPVLKLTKGGIDDLLNRLKCVEQYRDQKITMNIEEVDVNRIVFLTRYVKSYKFSQIQRLFEIYRDNQFEYFESVQITYSFNGAEITMPITPPLAEEHGGKLYLLEGNSRLTYLVKDLKVSRVKLIIVRNVSAKLPSTGKFTSQHLLISDEAKVGNTRYEEWDGKQYRHIEEAVRNPALYKDHYK